MKGKKKRKRGEREGIWGHTGGWKNVQPSRGHANPCLHGFRPGTGTGAKDLGMKGLGPGPEGRAMLTLSARGAFAKARAEGAGKVPDKEREEGAGWV